MMKKIIVVLILSIIAWKAYEKYGDDSHQAELRQNQLSRTEPELADDTDIETAIDVTSSSRPTFTCDGRVYCSQMKSCEEAKYFVAHCPNVKMDGDHDGIPCEQQCGA